MPLYMAFLGKNRNLLIRLCCRVNLGEDNLTAQLEPAPGRSSTLSSLEIKGELVSQ